MTFVLAGGGSVSESLVKSNEFYKKYFNSAAYLFSMTDNWDGTDVIVTGGSYAYSFVNSGDRAFRPKDRAYYAYFYTVETSSDSGYYWPFVRTTNLTNGNTISSLHLSTSNSSTYAYSWTTYYTSDYPDSSGRHLIGCLMGQTSFTDGNKNSYLYRAYVDANGNIYSIDTKTGISVSTESGLYGWPKLICCGISSIRCYYVILKEPSSISSTGYDIISSIRIYDSNEITGSCTLRTLSNPNNLSRKFYVKMFQYGNYLYLISRGVHSSSSGATYNVDYIDMSSGVYTVYDTGISFTSSPSTMYFYPFSIEGSLIVYVYPSEYGEHAFFIKLKESYGGLIQMKWRYVTPESSFTYVNKTKIYGSPYLTPKIKIGDSYVSHFARDTFAKYTFSSDASSVTVDEIRRSADHSTFRNFNLMDGIVVDYNSGGSNLLTRGAFCEQVSNKIYTNITYATLRSSGGSITMMNYNNKIISLPVYRLPMIFAPKGESYLGAYIRIS